MFKKIINKLTTMNPWHFLWISVIFSEFLVLTLTSILSYIWWGFVSYDLLAMGLIEALLVPLLVAPVVIYFVKHARSMEAINKDLLLQVNELRESEERVLRENEARYRSIVEDQTEFIDRFLPDGTLTFVNEACCRYFNKTRDELVGSNFMPLLPAEDEKRLKELLSSLTTEKPVARIEHRVITPDGETYWQSWINRAIFDKNGNIAEFQAVGRDITDRKRAERALAESEQLYRDLFDNAPVGLGITDKDGNLIAFNDAMLEPGGYTREDIEKIRNVTELYYDPEERGKVLAIAGKQGFLHRYRVQFRRKDGGPYDALLSLRFIRYQGSPCLQAMVEDITERRKMEDAVRKSEKRFRRLVETMNEGLGERDENGIITFVNDKFCQMTGYQRHEMVGKHISEFHDSPNKDILQQQTARREQGIKEPYEIELIRKDGQKILLHVSPELILDDSGQYRGSFAVFTDITQRKRMEELLRSYRDHLSLLTSRLSLVEEKEKRKIAVDLHDNIGQTLACANMMLGELKKSTDGDFRRTLDEVRSLIEQSIRYTRSLTSELGTPLLYEIGLESAVESLGREYQAKHGLNFSFHDDKKPKPIQDDTRVVLFQSIRELLTNAVKHARAGSLTISLERKNHSIQTVVEDDGVGFDVASLQDESYMNCGFGLFSVRERMKNIGGNINIASVPGSRTRIILTAPLKEAEEPGGNE